MLGCFEDAGFLRPSVTAIQATFEVPSVRWMLDNYAIMQVKISRLEPSQRRRFDHALADLLLERFSDNVASVTLEAHLGVGVR